MANNTTRVLSALPLGSLIGAPLKAVVEAQAIAARETVEFIKVFGCKPNPNNQKKDSKNSKSQTVSSKDTDDIEQDFDAGILREMIFHFSTENEDGTIRQHTLSAPLLSLIPIPVMSVQNMELDFAIKIDEMVTTTSENQHNRDNVRHDSANRHYWSHGDGNNRRDNHHFNARYTDKYTGGSNSNSQTQTSSSLGIKINVVSENLPLGLTKFLSTIDRLVAERIEDDAPAQVAKK